MLKIFVCSEKTILPHVEILYLRRGFLLIVSLRNGNGDISESGKNAIGLISKTIILHMHQAFLYISLPSMHEYDMEMFILWFC